MVLSAVPVEEPPTAMHAVGERHETADNVRTAPARPTTGERDQEVPSQTSPMARYRPEWPFIWLTRADAPTATQDVPPTQETPVSVVSGRPSGAGVV